MEDTATHMPLHEKVVLSDHIRWNRLALCSALSGVASFVLMRTVALAVGPTLLEPTFRRGVLVLIVLLSSMTPLIVGGIAIGSVLALYDVVSAGTNGL